METPTAMEPVVSMYHKRCVMREQAVEWIASLLIFLSGQGLTIDVGHASGADPFMPSLAKTPSLVSPPWEEGDDFEAPVEGSIVDLGDESSDEETPKKEQQDSNATA